MKTKKRFYYFTGWDWTSRCLFFSALSSLSPFVKMRLIGSRLYFHKFHIELRSMWIYDPEFSNAGRSIRTHLSVLTVNSEFVRRDPSAKWYGCMHSRYEKIVLISTPVFRGGGLPVNNCATNTQNGQKKIKSKICTIIFSINNSFKINGMIQLFGLTEEISRFTVGTS